MNFKSHHLGVLIILVIALWLIVRSSYVTKQNDDISSQFDTPNKSANKFNSQRHVKSRKVLWFMGVGGENKEVSEHYFSFVIAAINSAKINAPLLLPHVIYTGDESTIPKKLREIENVKFIAHNLTLKTTLQKYITNPVYGAYLRLDIPYIMEKLTPTLNKTEIDTEYVLYTDTDVLFFDQFSEFSLKKPRVMSIGPELNHNRAANSGKHNILFCIFY